MLEEQSRGTTPYDLLDVDIPEGPFAPGGKSDGSESVSNEFSRICGLNSFSYHCSYLQVRMGPVSQNFNFQNKRKVYSNAREPTQQ